MDEKPNIIFILTDAVRARNLNCYGYDKPTSPNIDKLAKEGILFENAFSCTVGTDPSLTTIFSGKYPLNHGIIQHGELITKNQLEKISKFALLPEVLKGAGYTTIGLDWLGRWHRRGYDYYMGFNSSNTSLLRKIWGKVYSLPFLYRQLTRFYTPPLPKVVFGSYDAETLTSKAIKCIRKSKKPFFLFIHYWDTHAPYNAPNHFIDNHSDGKQYDFVREEVLENIVYLPRRDYVRRMIDELGLQNIPARYDASIQYVDSQIGRLFDELCSSYDDTVIIFTSDHGESRFEHKVYFDHANLYEEIIHVPLIIKYPKNPKKRVVKAMVQHTDIIPTLLDILKIRASWGLDGKSLMPIIEDKNNGYSEIFTMETCPSGKICIRNNRYKYISAIKSIDWKCNPYKRIFEGKELYDLKNDPEELKNIVDREPEITIELEKRLNMWKNNLNVESGKRAIRQKIESLKSQGQLKIKRLERM